MAPPAIPAKYGLGATPISSGKAERFGCEAIRRMKAADAILFDGAVLLPNDTGLHVVTNSGGATNNENGTYEDSSGREIVNDSKRPLSAWLLTPILGNRPSNYRVKVDGKDSGWRLFQNIAERRSCSGLEVRATFPDGPRLFTPLGEIAPSAKRRVEMTYRAEGTMKE